MVGDKKKKNFVKIGLYLKPSLAFVETKSSLAVHYGALKRVKIHTNQYQIRVL
jgi:hypothetical protein